MFSQATIAGFSDELTKMAQEEAHVHPPRPAPSEEELLRHKELWKRLTEKSQHPVEIDPTIHEEEFGYFDPKTNKIVLRSEGDYETLAHEIGHAALQNTFLGKLVQNSVARGAFPFTSAAALVGGAMLAAGKKSGLLLPILTAAPTLLSEHLATRKGRQALEEVQATPEEIEKFKKELGASFSTYLGVIPASLASGAMGAMGYTVLR